MVDTILTDYQVKEVFGEIVHGAMTDMNTFERPDSVRVEAFKDVEITDRGISFTIPRCSVLHLTVK